MDQLKEILKNIMDFSMRDIIMQEVIIKANGWGLREAGSIIKTIEKYSNQDVWVLYRIIKICDMHGKWMVLKFGKRYILILDEFIRKKIGNKNQPYVCN
jgi:hypothetical protein